MLPLTTPDSLRIGLIIQARIASARLPGKALLPLPLGKGATLLDHVLRRAGRVRAARTIVVALPSSRANDPLAEAATQAGAIVFRGADEDVLARFVEAATSNQLDVVVRLTGDNPAIDPTFIDEAVYAHVAVGADYTTTTGLPLGMNVEVVNVSALLIANHQATDPFEREHVTPFLRRRPDRFRLHTLPLASSPEVSHIRLTVDYPTDYALHHILYSMLERDFGLQDVLSLFAQYPWLCQINSSNEQITS